MDNFHNVQDGKGGRKLVPFTAEEDAALAVRVAERTVEREKYDSLKYQRDRKAAYPDIGDQLDMQYWDQVNGTTTWKDHIAAVKAAHPKPE